MSVWRNRMLPFTIDQFLTVFEQYNQAIWPIHVLAYVLGIAVILCAMKKIRYADQVISAVLAFFWAWMGIVYHLMYFSTINRAAIGFGILFIIQAILLSRLAILHLRLRTPQPQSTKQQIAHERDKALRQQAGQVDL